MVYRFQFIYSVILQPMKKKNELSKQPINLMPYRLKSEDSLDFISNRNPYQAKFIYQLISSPDNSFSEMIKDFRSKGQEYNKVPITDNDFEGPSSILPEAQRIKVNLGEQNIRLQAEVRSLSIRNEELLCEVQYLREKIENMQSGSDYNEQTVRKLQKELKYQKEKQHPNQQRLEDLKIENEGLKEEIISLQSSMRRLKENRSMTRSTHESVKDTKQVYESISLYLKGRVEVLLNQMKNIVMSSRLESKLEDFLEEILLINQFTVNKMKRKPVEEIESMQEPPTLPYSVERVRLDKSIQKLKQIEREVTRDEKQMSSVHRGRNTFANMNFLTQIKPKQRQPSRSKSARRRIFGNN